MYDVVIAGAGPAGSAAALRLRREGLSVALADPALFPRPKICGEYLSAASVRELDDLGAARELQPFAHYLDKIRIRTGRAQATLPFSGRAWSLPRSVLDTALLDAASDAGACVLHARIDSVEPDSAGCTVHIRDDSGDTNVVRARVVIGADGAHSSVARSCGLTLTGRYKERFALGGHYPYAAHDDRALEMYVSGGSYFALNPLNDRVANVMLVVPRSDLHRHRDNVDAFMHSRIAALTGGRIDLRAGEFRGKRLSTGPLVHRTRRVGAPGVLLIGDAAHFVDPFTGQGVYLALAGAKLASQAVIAYLVHGVPQRKAWQHFEHTLMREIRRRSRLAALSSLAVRCPALAPAARMFAPLLEAVSA